MTVSLLVLLGAPALVVAMGVRVVPETQRFLLVRLGRVHGILGPGLRMILPFVDQVLRVDLNAWIPDWQRLPEHELDERLRQLYRTGQLSSGC